MIDFDYKFASQLPTGEKTHYGFIQGDQTIIFIKPGMDGSIYGYQQKYLKMASILYSMHGCSVICSSNQYANEHTFKDALAIIDRYAQKFNYYQIYYFGHSLGALMGARYGATFPQIKQMILVNGPLTINTHKTIAGAKKFNGEKITFVYGGLDPSTRFVDLLKPVLNNRIQLVIEPDADHHFSQKSDDFINLPRKFFFGNK